MKMIGKIFCKLFDRHKPDLNAGFSVKINGELSFAVCKYCGKRIVQDKKGKWF